MDEKISQDTIKPESDQALIEAFQAGKDAGAAFDELVLKYQNKIFNLCYRFLGDYAEADDCAQEVFLKVFRSLKNFRFEHYQNSIFPVNSIGFHSSAD